MSGSDVKKGAGIAGLVLGILAWLGERYEWCSAKTAEVLKALSFLFGVVATLA